MRKVYQFDGLNGTGLLSIGECNEPEQVLVHIECNGHEAHMRISRDEWQELMRLNFHIAFQSPAEASEGEAESRLKAV
jgi:hypothetical protein